ncbi:MAG: cytochrome c3 family protein [Thermoguttaceae bacterium]
MRTSTHLQGQLRGSRGGLVLVGLLCVGLASCQSPHQATSYTEAQPPRRGDPHLDQGWPRANKWVVQVCYQEVRAAVPKLQGAEYVNDDELCATCHGAYAKSFAAHNVHRRDGCESCHGPASRHLETRGKEPGLIFSFKSGDPVVRAEACLRCHEQTQCTEGARWRTSKHAHCGVTCVDCHRGHFDVPYGTPATTEPSVAGNRSNGPAPVALTAVHFGDKILVADKSQLPSLRGTSHHLGAFAPGVCYRCHGDMQDLQRIAGPHQICGPNGFNCTTCHDPHGQIKESTRRDLCLGCHKGAPTMAWHSSIHELNGVACTDCHDPHPRSNVRQFVNINHFQVDRPKRLPMSVQQPEACFKCHPKIYALTNLPAHHPIQEGKMVCSDCHDPHGQLTRNLRAETVNLLCYKCHAEKQGPFAYPHPPVTENCLICHEPHGTVAANLLRQPPVFLCLRCHSGHRRLASPSHPEGVVPANIDTNTALRQPLYTNCTQCHTQIHGSDLPSPTTPSARTMFR